MPRRRQGDPPAVTKSQIRQDEFFARRQREVIEDLEREGHTELAAKARANLQRFEELQQMEIADPVVQQEAAESQPKLPNGYAPVLLMLVGLAAAFAMASSRALPMLLASVGLRPAWLESVGAAAAPYVNLLMGVAALCFIGGVGFLWHQSRPGACVPGAICARPSVQLLTSAGLAMTLVLLSFGYRYVLTRTW